MRRTWSNFLLYISAESVGHRAIFSYTLAQNPSQNLWTLKFLKKRGQFQLCLKHRTPLIFNFIETNYKLWDINWLRFTVFRLYLSNPLFDFKNKNIFEIRKKSAFFHIKIFVFHYIEAVLVLERQNCIKIIAATFLAEWVSVRVLDVCHPLHVHHRGNWPQIT